MKTLPAAQIKKLLDSRSDREVLDGLRKVISVCASLWIPPLPSLPWVLTDIPSSCTAPNHASPTSPP